METLLHDLRYGVRMLRKSPGFTLVAVLALALGIGSAAAIFSVVDAVLLHSLPYPESDRILRASETERGTGAWRNAMSPANYLDLDSQNHVFSVMAASRGWQGNLTGGDRPERVRLTMTTASFFPLFGVNPMLGRGLLPDDAHAGSDHVVVLSYGLWQRRFAADRGLVGRTITLNEEPYTVVGVMPQGFSPDQYGELWVPSPFGVPTHPLTPTKDPRPMRDSNYLDVWARLKPGATRQQASAEVDSIAHLLEKQHPGDNDATGIGVVSLQDDEVAGIRPALLLLLAAVAFVLLIGCANVANLVLARSTARAREISIRVAMGASRLRLMRQLLTESLLLALAGGTAGVLFAVWAIPALLALRPPDLQTFEHIGVNREVLGFSLLVSAGCGILFGLVPAIHATGANPNESLKEGGRGNTGTRGRTRSALVVLEMGLSLVLLVGAGLMVKSFVRLMQVDPGFNPNRLLVFNIGLPPSASAASETAFYEQVVERIRALPGVEVAGAVSRMPLAGGNSGRSYNVPGSTKEYNADIRVSTPDYFRAMGIPLLKGRNLGDHDVQGSPQVAVVNEEMARRTFPGEDPIGKYITDFGPLDQTIQIVGVVGNIRHVSLESGLRPEIYLSIAQAQWPSMDVVVRTAVSNPTSLTAAVQNAVWSVDKNVPLANVRTMQDVIAKSVLRRRFTMQLLTIFAGLAMLLAAIGLYGVMSYSVSQRTQEIGIRMALGAQRKDVLRLVVKQGMVLALVGVGLGVLASSLLTKFLSGLLFAVSATDPGTFLAVAGLLAGVALLANYIPARRATRVDPMVALRYE
jgi:putative ABC transport system permease protein